MGKNIFRTSIENAFYFSLATFAIMWIAAFLYNGLEKTPGRLSMGLVVLIVLSLVLIMFLIGLTHLVLSGDENESVDFVKRLLAIFIFVLVSVTILVTLGLIFFYQV